MTKTGCLGKLVSPKIVPGCLKSYAKEIDI